jgi:hypothetical protein
MKDVHVLLFAAIEAIARPSKKRRNFVQIAPRRQLGLGGHFSAWHQF